MIRPVRRYVLAGIAALRRHGQPDIALDLATALLNAVSPPTTSRSGSPQPMREHRYAASWAGTTRPSRASTASWRSPPALPRTYAVGPASIRPDPRRAREVDAACARLEECLAARQACRRAVDARAPASAESMTLNPGPLPERDVRLRWRVGVVRQPFHDVEPFRPDTVRVGARHERLAVGRGVAVPAVAVAEAAGLHVGGEGRVVREVRLVILPTRRVRPERHDRHTARLEPSVNPGEPAGRALVRRGG